MVQVDDDVTSGIVGSYMTWIACMLRKIELIILVGGICIVYIDLTVLI